jgi:hypothetical protein
METRPLHGSLLLAAVLFAAGPSCGSDYSGSPVGGDDTGDPGGDDDHDRLTNRDETNLYQTDKDDPDSDDDGFTDGEEVLDYGTNPTNPYNRPYTGDYRIGDCATYPTKGIGPTGTNVIPTGPNGGTSVGHYLPGDTLRNERLVDQYGELVDLWSFCGVNLDILFVQWNQLGGVPEYDALTCWIRDMPNVQRYYRDYGYQLVVVLTQNSAQSLPTTKDVQAFATMMWGEDANQVPVLASADESVAGFHTWFEKDFHEPTLVHMGRALDVLSVDNDDCSGADRDPCPYMGDVIPEAKCWNNPDECEHLDSACACPAPACEAYCGEGNCPQTY